MNKTLHILLIHQAFVALDEAGGTRHFELAQHLVNKGHQVTVITSRVSYLTGSEATKRIRSNDSVKVLRAFTFGGLHQNFFLRLMNFFSFALSSFFIGLSVREVDIVWGTSPPIFQSASAWALARLKRVPFLFEVRDLWPAFAVAVGVLQNRVLIAASEWLERFLYRRADAIVLNSPGFLDHVRGRGGRHISVVPNGADARMFDPSADGAEFRAKHGLQDMYVVLYAGAHGLSNDLGVVLRAAELLKDKEKVAIVLLGDGKDKSKLQHETNEKKLANVFFLAPMPKTEMGEALAAANACLAILKPVDLYATVFPNKVFDYMAAGRPVLLAIDGVVREMLEKAGAGVFVQPGDAAALANAIRQMAANPADAKRMGAAGRAYLEKHFDRAKLAGEMEAVLIETAKKAR